MDWDEYSFRSLPTDLLFAAGMRLQAPLFRTAHPRPLTLDDIESKAGPELLWTRRARRRLVGGIASLRRKVRKPCRLAGGARTVRES